MMSKQSPSRLRNQACRLAPDNWAAAAEVAGQIADPWYACQAYAWCGRFAPGEQSGALIDEALRQAGAGRDRYQRLAAAAWPLRALIETGRADRAADVFAALAPTAGEIDPPSSRAEACFLVFQAVAVGPPELAFAVLRWLLAAVHQAAHWRSHRAARDAVIQAVTLRLIDTGDVPSLVPDERLAAEIEQRLTQGTRHLPRPFF